MNIEELFDNELWSGYGLLTTEDANCAINYLKTETMEYVAGLQKRIAELADLLVDSGVKIKKQSERIAELEKRIAEAPPVAGSETEPEPDFTGRVAELEAALKLAMDWLEDEVPKYIVDELINSLR